MNFLSPIQILIILFLIYLIYTTHQNESFVQEGQICDRTNPCLPNLECYRHVCVIPRPTSNISTHPDFFSDMDH